MATKPHTLSAADMRAQERVRGMGAIVATAMASPLARATPLQSHQQLAASGPDRARDDFPNRPDRDAAPAGRLTNPAPAPGAALRGSF